MKVSSSGREIRRPKKIQTTSSDDAPVEKWSKHTECFEDKLKFLREQLKDIESKRSPKTIETKSNKILSKKSEKKNSSNSNSHSDITVLDENS